jgi:VIT1/CCC1 family predicted Fe2+/Mn2+ transporter
MERSGNNEMKRADIARIISIGLIDGLTIPFAIATGLTAASMSSYIIFIACIAAPIVYSLIMGISAYLSGRRYEPSSQNLPSAFIISISYITGGLIPAVPFFFIQHPFTGLRISAAVTLSALLIAGYYDSRLNGAVPFTGALRIALTGVAAAFAAFLVAGLFN